MKNSSISRSGTRLSGRIVGLIKGSVIISTLDRFCLYIYGLLSSGMFARIFSADASYKKANRTAPARQGLFGKLRAWLSRLIDSSWIVETVTSFANNMIYCRLRVIGVFFVTLASFSGIIPLMSLITSDSVVSTFDSYVRICEAGIVALISVFFLSSKRNISQVIYDSGICTWIIENCGFSVKSPKIESNGKYAVSFILGTACGLASVFVSPLIVILLPLALIYLYALLATPEFGIVSLFFLMPFAPTMVLAVLVMFISFAFLVKLIRGKRVLNFRLIDFLTLVLAFILLSSGFISLSSESVAPSIIFFIFIAAYFLLSCCVRSYEWLTRCTVALMFSALIVSLIGIFQYVLGSSSQESWLDSNLFSGISGRAVSTLENPNMLGEYLILIIPVVAGIWLSGVGVKRKTSFVAFACMTMCLILTWSRGAWLGFIFSAIVFLLIWNRRSMWILVCGLLSLPFLPFILPDSIVARISSIGNLADTSTSYRVSIWRAAMNMIEDNLLSGIGTGQGAWNVIYSDYSLPGIELAPHSHNLFMQLTLESGIFALILLMIIVLLLTKLSFSTFSSLSDMTGLGIEKREAVTYRLQIAGPLCGIFAVLVQGLTDYSWYNYRVYLMFWLVIGLIPAFVKNAETALSSADSHIHRNTADESRIDIPVINKVQ